MTLTERMQEVRDKAHFTTSDMAVWFYVSRAAMHTWLHDGRHPHGSKVEQLTILLDALEIIINHTHEILPVPLDVRQYARAKYIKKVRDYAVDRISATGSAGERGEVLGSN